MRKWIRNLAALQRASPTAKLVQKVKEPPARRIGGGAQHAAYERKLLAPATLDSELSYTSTEFFETDSNGSEHADADAAEDELLMWRPLVYGYQPGGKPGAPPTAKFMGSHLTQLPPPPGASGSLASHWRVHQHMAAQSPFLAGHLGDTTGSESFYGTRNAGSRADDSAWFEQARAAQELLFLSSGASSGAASPLMDQANYLQFS